MANKYNDILTLVNAGNNMGLSNTIKRDYGIPLDFTSVQETYDAAVIYAATSTLAYVGQTVAVDGKLYIISDTANGIHTVGEGEDAKTYDNYLAEVGSKTEGDGNTIELDGQTLKLAGLTGLDNSKTYVPSLVNGKLVWAEPDTSTAEGQAQEINALKTRTAELEATVNGVEAAEGVEAKEGLVGKVAAIEESVNDEVAAREAADTALEGKIAEALQAAKDYADENDADTIYDDTQVKADIETNKTAIEGLQTSLGNVYTKTEVDGKLQEVNDTIAGITHFTTQIVESVDDVTAIGVLYLIKDTEVEGVDKYNEYLYIEGQGAVLIGDTTTDLSDYVTNDALTAAIADFVTTEGLASAIAGKADQTAVDEALALKANAADVVANSTFDTFKTANDEAIAAARTGAVADVEAKGYAVAADVDADLAKKIETGTIAHAVAAVEADPEKGIEAVEGIPEGVTVEGTTMKIVVDAPTRAETIQLIADKVAQVTGGESAADVKLSLEAEVERSTAKDTAHDNALAKLNGEATVVGSVAEAKAAADAAQQTADDAVSAINTLTSGQVKTNTEDITAVKGRLTTLETAKGDHETRIATAEGKINSLETATANNASAIGALQGKDTELVAEDARLAGLIDTKANASDVYTKTEVDNTVAGINTEIGKKANTEDVYTKTEVDEALANLDQTELENGIQANADALAILIGSVEGDNTKSARAIAKEEVATIVGAAPEAMNTLEEVATWISNDESGAAAMANDIAVLKTAVDTGNKTVSAFVNDALAAIIQPKASEEITVAEDGTLGIAQVNVNKLVQTTGDTLILDGGAAV